MKLLISSYCPLTISGYSNQIKQIIKGLYQYNSEIEIGIICWDIPEKIIKYSSQYYSFDKLCNLLKLNYKNNPDYNIYQNIKFYFCGEKGNYWEKINTFNQDFKCDKLLVYQDIWVFEKYDISKINCEKYLYLPIHDDFRENKLLNLEKSNNINLHVNTLQHLPYFDKLSTFSKFGIEVLKSYNYESTFINHIIHKKTYEITKEEARKQYNINQDFFICLMIARNGEPGDRKAFVQQFTGFRLFLNQLNDTEKSRCRLLLHENNTFSLEGGAINLKEIANQLQIEPYIIMTDKTFTQEQHIINLFKLSDVLLCASKSEGFGMPMVESQIYGTPVITCNNTSMPENTYLGICTEPKDISNTIHGINSWSNPCPNNISEAIQYFYNKKYNKYMFLKLWFMFFKYNTFFI